MTREGKKRSARSGKVSGANAELTCGICGHGAGLHDPAGCKLCTHCFWTGEAPAPIHTPTPTHITFGPASQATQECLRNAATLLRNAGFCEGFEHIFGSMLAALINRLGAAGTKVLVSEAVDGIVGMAETVTQVENDGPPAEKGQ